jgi:hypothetical protein
MENEREIAQWYVTAGLYEAPAIFNAFPEHIRRQCFTYGSPAAWDRLPMEAKQAVADRRAAVRAEGERIAAEIIQREADRVNAHLLLGQLTDARFEVYALAGPRNAAARASLMTLLTGVKVPQAKSGVNALKAAFYADMRGECEREKELNFLEYCGHLCRSQRNNPGAQALADKARARREEQARWTANYTAQLSAAAA